MRVKASPDGVCAINTTGGLLAKEHPIDATGIGIRAFPEDSMPSNPIESNLGSRPSVSPRALDSAHQYDCEQWKIRQDHFQYRSEGYAACTQICFLSIRMVGCPIIVF
jgi:hypothetical protein